jgi:hypothetical protein
VAEQLTIESFILRAQVRRSMRKLRTERRERGLCQCGSAPIPGRRRCERCKVADDHSNAMRAKHG